MTDDDISPPTDDGLRIVRLTAENIMGLRVVDIAPDGKTVVIGGQNGSGKSSILNAIFLALGGKDAAKAIARPVRDNETDARVQVDLGDLVVTRTWRNGSTALIVESADGNRFSSPAAVLDGLKGSLTFDPLAFMRAKPMDQVTSVLGLLDLDIDIEELDRERQRLYDERRAVGVVARDLKGQLEALPDPGEMPSERPDLSAVVARLTEAQQTRAENREQVQQKDAAVERLARLREEEAAAVAALERIRATVARVAEEVDALEEWTSTLVDPDVAAIEAEMAAIEADAERWRLGDDRRRVLALIEERDQTYKAFTDSIAEIDDRKEVALAEATMPIKGLGFAEDGLTFNGHPLVDCCDAEKRQVSIAIGKAANPDLRIMLIRDGALLDDDTLDDIRFQAGSGGFQLWIEDVGDDRASIVMSNGEIVEVRGG